MIKVYISLERIQTFLMAVPRLKEMLGANVLLAETVRRELTGLVESSAATPVDRTGLTGNDRLAQLQQADPLNRIASELDQDSPIDLVEKRHVLQRDGGHFAALFNDDGEAEVFIREAQKTLAEYLPGIHYTIRKEKLDNAAKDGERLSPRAKTLSPVDLPVFQVCQESGNGPAYKKGRKDSWISHAVDLRNSAGDRFKSDTPTEQTHDIAGIITRHFGNRYGTVSDDFKQLCGDEYMAVIHADGNGMGGRGNDWREQAQNQHGKHSISAALQEELLYYDMRVKVRAAVVNAIEATFQPVANNHDVAPFQILMLGGDDLLLVCRAQYALPFVRHYAQALGDAGPLLDGEKLGIGAGVVIASHSLPFHHLHALAEELASSAKTLYRQAEQPSLSVVDWMVCTASWSDDPIKLRRQTALTAYRSGDQEERLLSSAKPYPVLQNATGQSLAALLEVAEALRAQNKSADNDGKKGARSQWRKLVGQLRSGRLQADLCFREMPEGSRKPFAPLLDKQSLWHGCGEGSSTYLTYVADAVELYEIPNLKSAKEER